MKTEEDEISVDSTLPGTPTKISIEKHNLKVRRRNLIETVKENEFSNSENNVPLVRMSDSTRAWHDNVIPRIPDIADFSSSGKQSGVLDDSSLLERDFDSTETLTNREQMKINIIRGSIVNPNLTLGELRLLGCSSEGFVNGIVSIEQYIIINKESLCRQYDICIYTYM